MDKKMFWWGITVFVVSILLFFLSGATMNGRSIPLIYGSPQPIWMVTGFIGFLMALAGIFRDKKGRQKGKKAALELSIGTIVIIVIAVTMLILGLILVRTIMCGALVTSLDLTQKMKDQINKLFQDTGNDVVMLSGPSGVVSIPPGESSAIWFAFKPEVQADYNYEFEVYLADKYKRTPYAIKERDVESWFTTPLSGKETVGTIGKSKNLIIKPPRDSPQFEFTLKLRVNKVDRAETQIEIKKQGWAYKAFC